MSPTLLSAKLHSVEGIVCFRTIFFLCGRKKDAANENAPFVFDRLHNCNFCLLCFFFCASFWDCFVYDFHRHMEWRRFVRPVERDHLLIAVSIARLLVYGHRKRLHPAGKTLETQHKKHKRQCQRIHTTNTRYNHCGDINDDLFGSKCWLRMQQSN